MFWAACNLAYFGFLRSSEFTVPNLASFSKESHLSLADIAIDSYESPSCLRLHLKATKTDPFRKGCFIRIGKGNFPLCAIHSLMTYLIDRGDEEGPLFLYQDGRPLTDWLRRILSAAGVPGTFSSHSFCIGAATVASRNGIPDHLIQAFGPATPTNCTSGRRLKHPRGFAANWLSSRHAAFTGLSSERLSGKCQNSLTCSTAATGAFYFHVRNSSPPSKPSLGLPRPAAVAGGGLFYLLSQFHLGFDCLQAKNRPKLLLDVGSLLW